MNISINGRSDKILIKILFVIIAGSFFISGCKTDPVQPADEYGKIKFTFDHRINGQAIVFDEMKYTNEADNQYLVNEIQYFISDVTIHTQSGEQILLDEWEDIHYVDTDILNTQTYAFKDEIPPGNYSKISYTFGINEQKNQSLMFLNQPESFMFWPEYLGGGYHYMKLNGKWLDTLNQVSPFDFHLGIGQVYHSFPDSITSFIHNYFKVELPGSSFEMKSGQTIDFTIVMNVENWFKSPTVYDHNQWGGDIMQTQDAMKVGCNNGWDVFSIEK